MDKSSFILYSDYEQDFDLLTSEEAGEMIKAIFSYINRGEMPNFHDRSLVMVFSRIIRDIDRNSEKWEETKQARSVAGHKGGLISGQKRKQNEANEAKPSNASKNEANEAKRSNASFDEANEANEAVNVNVNVNVNDNVNVIVNEETEENGNVDNSVDNSTTTTTISTQINKWCYEHLKPCKKDNENKKEIENILSDNSFDVNYLDFVYKQTLDKYPKKEITSSLILSGCRFESALIEYKRNSKKNIPKQNKIEKPKPPENCPVCGKRLVVGGIPDTYRCACSPNNYYEYDYITKTWKW